MYIKKSRIYLFNYRSLITKHSPAGEKDMEQMRPAGNRRPIRVKTLIGDLKYF